MLIRLFAATHRAAFATTDPTLAHLLGRPPTALQDVLKPIVQRAACGSTIGIADDPAPPHRDRPAMGSHPADTLPVRLDPERRQVVEDRAAADDMTASDVVRTTFGHDLKSG